MQKSRLVIVIMLAIFALVGNGIAAECTSLQELGKILVGKILFFDSNLSEPRGQSCAACHGPDVGFTGPDEDINIGQVVYPGAVSSLAGNRKPPSSAYGGDSPILDFDELSGLWIGGMFWDGRATGWTLKDPLAEQAQGPFLNPLEQNMPSAMAVVSRVRQSWYAPLFKFVWGPRSLDKNDVAGAYEKIARSIAAYERSPEVSSFTSKYDYYLKGKVALSAQERRGLKLFNGKAKCSLCHISARGANGKPLFTDFTYDNLGVPKNPKNPFYKMLDFNPLGTNWVDLGLGGFLKSISTTEDPIAWESEVGKHKVPTLRNVDKRPYPEFVKAYGHNGYFKSLEEIVHFYNTRDVKPWPAPEVAANVNTNEMGNLRLTAMQEADVVAFLKTLSDGYHPCNK